MPNITRRKLARAAAAGAAGALAAPSLALAQAKRWKMVTSWPKRLPGPGMSAERVAERIRTLSGGRLDIAVHAAGEIVPAFEVLDAVGGGEHGVGLTVDAAALLAAAAELTPPPTSVSFESQGVALVYGRDEVAIEAARRRGPAEVTYEVRDVTELSPDDLGTFDFFLDVGCFQGFDAQQRAAVGRGVTALAEPGARAIGEAGFGAFRCFRCRPLQGRCCG